MKPRISAVVNTLNEEKNLPCTAVGSALGDEIVVVDMYSTDRTAEIALYFEAKVYLHEREGFVEPACGYTVDTSIGRGGA